jgi:hypothetical protein
MWLVGDFASLQNIINQYATRSSGKNYSSTFPSYDTHCIANDASNNSSLPWEVFTKMLPSNDGGIHRQTHRLSIDKGRTIQKMTCPTIPLLLHVFIAVGIC